MPKPREVEKPMHFNEVVEFLGMGTDYVYKNLQAGNIKGRKLGTKWVVFPSDLIKFIESQPGNRKRLQIAK